MVYEYFISFSFGRGSLGFGNVSVTRERPIESMQDILWLTEAMKKRDIENPTILFYKLLFTKDAPLHEYLKQQQGEDDAD